MNRNTNNPNATLAARAARAARACNLRMFPARTNRNRVFGHGYGRSGRHSGQRRYVRNSNLSLFRCV